MLRRTHHHLARLCGALFVGLLVAVAFVTWRLSQGPVSLSLLVPTVQSALARPDLGLEIAIADARLQWPSLTDDPEIVAIDVRARGPDGAELLAVPELRLTLSAAALLSGIIAPARIEVSRLRVSLIRKSDGTVDFGLQAADAPVVEEPAAEEAALSGITVSELLDPPVPGKPGGYLREVVIENAAVMVRDRRRGTVWQAAPAEVRVVRNRAGVTLSAALAVQYGGRTGTAWLEAHRLPRGTRTNLSADLGAARLDLLAPFLPNSALVGLVDAPVSGRISAVLEQDDRITAVQADLTADSGTVRLPGTAGPLAFQRATVRGRWDAAAGRIEIGRVGLTTAGNEATAEGLILPRVDGATVDLRFGNLRLDALVPALPPDAAALGGLALPVSGTLAGVIGTDGRPRSGRAEIALGAGRLGRFGLFEAPIDLKSGGIAVAVAEAGRRIVLERATLDAGGPVFTAKGAVALDPARVAIELEAELRSLPVAAARRFWPVDAAAGGRSWVVANMRDGTVPRATAKASLVLAPDFKTVLSHAVTGSLDFSGVATRYWEPMPLLRDAKGSIAFTDKRLDIKVESAADGRLLIDGATIVLSGFDKGAGTAEIDAGIKAPFVDLMTLLDRPPLGYAKKLDVTPAELAGQVQGRLKIKLPLLSTVLMEQVELNAKAVVEGAKLPRAALGRDLTEARVEADVDKRRIVAKGAGLFGGSPAKFEVTQAFELSAREQLRADATIDLTDAARRSYDYGTGPLTVEGPLTAQINYLDLRGGRGELKGTLDLSRATLGLKQIGWKKAPGDAATATLSLVLQKGRAVTLDSITLKADRFDGAASVLFDETSQVRRVDVSRVRYGDTDLALRATLADRVITIDGQGAAFDLQPILSDLGKPKPTGPDGVAVDTPPEPEFRVRMNVDRLRMSKGPPLRGARTELRLVDGDVVTAALEAVAGSASTPVSARITEAGGRRRMTLQSADAGAVFAALDMTDQVRGGQLTVQADRNPAVRDSPYAGRVDITGGFRLVNAPFMARLLGAAAITGIGDLLSADSGLAFDKLEAPLRFRGGRFDLEPGRMYGTSVGVTWRGMMDLGRNEIDIAGTVVPAYALNRVLGSIPVLGYLITGGSGSGALAATYRATGHLDQPTISVNPLTMLLPGFLRGLFDAIQGEPGRDGASPQGEPGRPAAPRWDPSLDPVREAP